jgi:hypothetical protein
VTLVTLVQVHGSEQAHAKDRLRDLTHASINTSVT